MSNEDLVVVYGALRSGSTMFRLMLNAHPLLSNPGETDFLTDNVVRTGKDRFQYDVEKLSGDRIFQTYDLALPQPGEDARAVMARFVQDFRRRQPDRLLTLNIHRNIEILLELHPAMRIIHLLRDPRDVARSAVGMGWAQTPYFGVDMWIDTERAWDRVRTALRPDQTMELRYESLVSDPRPELERVCAFLDVPFREDMLDYQTHTTYDAPSAKFAFQWKTKMPTDIRSLVEGRVGSLLTERGYTPSGVVPRVPGTIESVRLRWANKFWIWKFRTKRYGLALSLVHKIAGRLGLRVVSRYTGSRINEKTKALLR